VTDGVQQMLPVQRFLHLSYHRQELSFSTLPVKWLKLSFHVSVGRPWPCLNNHSVSVSVSYGIFNDAVSSSDRV
jgi:hypothetical protein